MSERKMYFKHMGRTHRICRRTGNEKDGSERVENVVQVWDVPLFSWTGRWVDVDVEVVPTFAWIAMACFGDCGSWRSKLHERWDQVIEQSPECERPR